MNESPLISASDLKNMLDAGSKLAVFDCRFSLGKPAEGREVYQRSHLPGAFHADLERNLSGEAGTKTGRHPLPEKRSFETWLSGCGVDQDSSVVAYDDHDSIFAARLWWFLGYFGHDPTKTKVLDGGWKAWLGKGYPAADEIPTSRQGDFKVRTPKRDRVLRTVDEVERKFSREDFTLIDARAPERFRGENEIVDKKGGHVPKAINRFFKRNMTDDGRFKSPETLRREWRPLTESAKGEICMMCGSGVTACNNALALEVAGLLAPSLYLGSWSEWITDDERPVATGNGAET